jgi:hypothetical protein
MLQMKLCCGSERSILPFEQSLKSYCANIHTNASDYLNLRVYNLRAMNTAVVKELVDETAFHDMKMVAVVRVVVMALLIYCSYFASKYRYLGRGEVLVPSYLLQLLGTEGSHICHSIKPTHDAACIVPSILQEHHQEVLVYEKAAVVVQAVIRGSLARWYATKKKSSVLRIQSFMRSASEKRLNDKKAVRNYGKGVASPVEGSFVKRQTEFWHGLEAKAGYKTFEVKLVVTPPAARMAKETRFAHTVDAPLTFSGEVHSIRRDTLASFACQPTHGRISTDANCSRNERTKYWA